VSEPDDADILSRAAHISGVDIAGATPIRVGAHAIYRLPNDIVARIGQPHTCRAAEREMQVSRWLNSSGIPTVEAASGMAQPVIVEDRPVTWWRTIPSHRPATPAELGAMLRAVHRLRTPDDFTLPTYDPFADVADRIARADRIDRDDRAWLSERHHRLRDTYSRIPASAPTVIHGDAWQGNLVVTDSTPPILLDLDKVSLGRPEWDLIQLAVDHADFSRLGDTDYRAFVDAYGGYDVTSSPWFRLFADIQELRWTCFAAFLDSDAAVTETRYRIECLQGLRPKPWTWTAL